MPALRSAVVLFALVAVHHDVPDVPPTSLVQAEHDPTTPYPGAKATQRRLPGSRMVTLHDSYSHEALN